MILQFKNHEVNCEWNDWTIGDCSLTCGGGTRTKTRVPKVLAEHGGEACKGPTTTEERCNEQNCTGKAIF